MKAEYYGKNHLLNKVLRIQTMDEADHIAELTKQVQKLKAALADAHIDQTISESYLELACQRLGVDPTEFKKTRGPVITMSRAKDTAISVTGLCKRADVSRQAYYQGRRRRQRHRQAHRKVLQWVRTERAKYPRMGGRKLYHRLKPKMRAKG